MVMLPTSTPMALFYKDGVLTYGDFCCACTIGRDGLVAAEDKREGDYKTPLGEWPLREIWVRVDRVGMIETKLPVKMIAPDDGWCDDPNHAFYNKPVKLPFEASHEKLWRDDGAYDIIVVLGYNDAPAVAGRGSAIFMHCMHDDGRPTAGCLALAREDLVALLSVVTGEVKVTIS